MHNGHHGRWDVNSGGQQNTRMDFAITLIRRQAHMNTALLYPSFEAYLVSKPDLKKKRPQDRYSHNKDVLQRVPERTNGAATS